MATAAPKKARRAPAPREATTDKNILRRRYQGQVRVGLAPGDREPLVKELTGKLRENDAMRLEAANVAAGYRKKINDITDEIKELALKLDQGVPEPAELEEIKDFNTKKVTIIRVDTKAVVEKRDMTEKDQQIEVGSKSDAEDQGEEKDDDEDLF